MVKNWNWIWIRSILRLIELQYMYLPTTNSLSVSLRQRPTRYAIHAGRNLPDKGLRYLRTVIVTAAVYLSFYKLLPIHIQSTGQKSHCVNTFSRHHNAMFLLNSRILLVRFSSESIVTCARAPYNSNFKRLGPALRQVLVYFHCPSRGLNTQSSEPILFPKLRI